MDAVAYHSLLNLQDRHWWFVARRKVISQLIRRLVTLPSSPRILEAGCGYGGNLGMLARFGDVDGFEYDEAARAYASTLLAKPVAPGFLPDNIGFQGAAFDLVAMLDVLEHIDDDIGALRNLKDRLCDSGFILITVPALPWLWSEHDEIHHHKRRYTKAGIRKVLQQAGFEVVSVSYFNSLLFPLALIQRLTSRVTRRRLANETIPNRFVNGLLQNIFAFESLLVGRINMPIGLSLYAVGRCA